MIEMNRIWKNKHCVEMKERKEKDGNGNKAIENRKNKGIDRERIRE